MPLVEAIISAEMATTNEKPSAMRMPVRMSGKAFGKKICQSIFRSSAPSDRALQTTTGGVARTP